MSPENGDNREESADHIWCRKGYYLCIKMSAQHYLQQSQVLVPINREAIFKREILN